MVTPGLFSARTEPLDSVAKFLKNNHSMKMKNQKVRSVLNPDRRWFSFGVVALAAGSLAAQQSVIYTGPLVPVTPEAEREQRQQNQTNSPNVFIPASEARHSDLPQIFRNGPLSFRPHFGYQFLYGTGIQSTPAISGKTEIHSITPGFTLEYGTHWALDYTPSLVFYSNNQFHDTVGHSVSLSGHTQYEDWQFSLGQSYNVADQVLAETGGQNQQENFSTSLNASRILNDKMSAEFGFAQKMSDTDGFQSSSDWSLSAFLNYQFWERLTVSGGANFGYVSLDLGGDQTYQLVQTRLKWRITDKLGLAAHAGGEAREFAGGDTLFSPVYGATLEWQPRQRTQLSLGVSSAIQPSLFAGSVTESTSVSASINQQIFKKFSLSAGASFSVVDYTQSGGKSNRRDEGNSYNVSLSHPIFKRGTLSAIYQFGDNRSSQNKFTYRTDQVGGSFNYAF
jgi:Putative beta-barrel porin 2